MLTLTDAGTMGTVTDSEDTTMRARRKRAGITIKAIATKAGVAPNTVSRVERGEDAHKRELVLAALDALLKEKSIVPVQVEPDTRNLRAVTAHLPRGQTIVSVDQVRDLSRPGVTVFTVVAAGDGTDDDELRTLLEALARRVERTDGG